jgi:hypothetical protein
MPPVICGIGDCIAPRHYLDQMRPCRSVYTIVMIATRVVSLPPVRRPARWLVPLVVTAMLHWLAFHWLTGDVRQRARPVKEPVITTTIIELPVSRPPPKVTPKPAPPPTAARTPTRRAPPVVDAAAISMPGISIDDIGSVAGPDLAALSEQALDTMSLPVTEVADATPAMLLPPPIELAYDVKQMSRASNPTYGHGTIRWQTDGSTYRIDGNAGVLFFDVLDFRSEGRIDQSGIAPVRYSEKRFRRPEANTHFHRERRIISFSASGRSYPRLGGEQDRASVIWQLASMGRSGGAAFTPGADFDIFVAGVRDGEVWRIEVIGKEELDIDGTTVATWHLRRVPYRGSSDKQLDIWLAPQREWYPVRLRFTDPNDDYLEMTLSEMKPIAAPSVTAGETTR